MSHKYAEEILRSRRALMDNLPEVRRAEEAAEGGCGVLGFTANIPVAGRHVLSASRQMHNRGNGKGGGIAMVGLDADQARVPMEILSTHYLLQIALLEPEARREVEEAFILPHFDIAQSYELPHVDDFRQVPGLEVRPPDVWRYFVRVKGEALARFGETLSGRPGLVSPEGSREAAVQAGSPVQAGAAAAEATVELEMDSRALEDEFVYQNSYRLNVQFYASLGEKRAFVLSHGRDLSVLKIVGYAEDVVDYYLLHDQTAHVWIAHQRYPTKGRVWHPGGAHPFIGLNEALVHNGDFANYHAVSEYLRQRNIGQLFLTDTEVSVQLFDLWERVYGYPLEITLEAMAPTTEFDFSILPEEKQALYRAVQRAHIHGSPDGPWFFILARSLPDERRYELLGITDTSMLRPQVFALYENEQAGDKVKIGLIASERQAINACLRSLAAEDERFQPTADKYWAARGGSHTDGGAFRFTYTPGEGLVCANKFGTEVRLEGGRKHARPSRIETERAGEAFRRAWEVRLLHAYDNGGVPSLWGWLAQAARQADWDELAWGLEWLNTFARQGDEERRFALECLNWLRDRRFDPGDKKRASLLRLVDRALEALLEEAPGLDEAALGGEMRRITWERRQALRAPRPGETALVVDADGFQPEGEQSAARLMALAYELGWRTFFAYHWRGGRFAGCGLGPETFGARLDLYGDVGDYAASGLDGAELHIHGDGQDQLGQIFKDGKLVVHGDVGQTFLYGAKGGEIYVAGSAAGRPLINAVGRPRAVINGTCLDYLAESFMAGDPLEGGGFVIVNGVAYDESGCLVELETPYPGGNLFSLASGGAIYLRDPRRKVSEAQLNGGVFSPLTEDDWALIEPYLRENERLFGIGMERLLTVDGERRRGEQVYRKVGIAGG